MILVLAMAFAPFVVAQVDTVTMGCPRRLNFDLSSDGTDVSFEWTSASDPTGTVYTPNYGGTCGTGANGGPYGSASAADSPDCPTNGVPYGMNSTHQLDQTGVIYPGYAPFSPTASGTVRIRNIAYDAENGGRAVDMLVQVIPDASMVPYTSLVEMKFNSVVMPWNNDVPASQFRLISTGLVALGYGVLPASCPSGDLVGASLPFCTDAVGYGAEYDLKFVYDDTFSYSSWELVDPALDPYYVVFWDVDGDTVSNGLLNSNFTDIAGNPPEPQENGAFPSSLVNEELFEVHAVFDAQALVFSGSSLIVESSTQDVVRGTGPPAGFSGNIQTDFSSNPYRAVNAAFSELNKPAVAVYQVQPLTTGFRLLIGAVSAVGRQYRYNGLEQPYGLVRTGTGVTSPNGPFPKRQNDRGFLFSLLYPEPYCDCDDECPVECADPATADANCARNPNCVCPDACQVANPPGVCGASAQCPSVACPAECDLSNTTSFLHDYYAYCRRNPSCACPSKCSGCATEAPGSDTCALDCNQYAGCSTSPPSPSCVSPPSSPAGAAGNDPIFVGADGIPYRVDGQAGRAFNLVSSPCLSVNSEVQEVPPRFQYPRLGLTSTVFGSMHVSVGCRNTTERIGSDGFQWNNSQRTRVDAHFDVLSGTILCRMPSKGHLKVSCDTVLGLKVAEYYWECDLEDMTCDWFPVSAKWSRSLSLAHVQPGITQTRLHIGDSVMVFTRDSLRQFNNVTCNDFRRWPKAREACHLVVQHLSAAGVPQNAASLSEETIQRYLAILAAYRGMLVPAHTVFFFFHLTVEHLDARDFSDPALLHGLLGQRLLSPRPVPNRSNVVIHPDHILKSAGAVNMLVSDLGSQGEGFIEGTYRDYMVPSLDNHCSFPFSRFLGDEC